MRKHTGPLQAFVKLDTEEVPAWPSAMPVPARTLAAIKHSPWDSDGIMIPASQVRMALGMNLAVIRETVKDYLMVYEEVAFFATPLYPKGMYSTFQYFN